MSKVTDRLEDRGLKPRVQFSYQYNQDLIALAATRGYNDTDHRAAIEAQDVDAISLTHPMNWLTEDEVEDFTSGYW